MILNVILGSLAFLSVALLLWQWVAAFRFPLHRRNADLLINAKATAIGTGPSGGSTLQPAVSLLKPLKGYDAATEDCLRSWFAQDYAGEVQILFAVVSLEDPVCAIVQKLREEFPHRDVQLIECKQLIGTNAKVSKLVELEKLVKHEIIVVSDADVRVPADFLANVVEPLTPSLSPSDGERDGVRGEIGLVNCFYRLANPQTLAMQWEAIAINADFWSQVLQSKSLKPLDFALGAVMVTTRQNLGEIGGFKALADCLADDYQLGNRIAKRGHSIFISPVAVECWDPPMDWRAVWKHQLRWARTIRVSQPVPYFFSILSNPTLWPLIWAAAAPGKLSLGFLVAALLVRIFITAHLQSRLTQSMSRAAFSWLAPIKDVLQFAIWVGAFAGNRIEWRGQSYRLRPDGTLEKK